VDSEGTRFLFNALREDIKLLREEIHTILERHEKEIEQSKDFRLKLVGAGALFMLVLEIAFKVAEAALLKQ